MDGPDGFPVFFECPSLNEEQKKRVENYFRIKRKSGGGECSSVTEVEEKVYSVVFKERDAQQRVLQKPKHELEVEGGPLVLTVRDNPGPNKSHNTTPTSEKLTNPKQDLTSSQQNLESSLLSSLSPSGEEYELQLDSYVFRYLKECPKAKTELEKKLASASCSAQFHSEEDKFLVRLLAQPGAVGAGAAEVSNWKSEVDKLFDSYLSHYELDPHKIKALLESCSSDQSTGEVKVYSEIGMAVVVGEYSQVKARLTESLCVKHRGSSSGDSKTAVRRLGEAKLRLLRKEIESSLGEKFPKVKVTQADEGKLLLEGSVDDILKASELISEKENLVFERTVSDKTPHFLAFLKQVYGGPGMLCDILGAGDKVEVELRDTELHFFSLNANKLDESEKKMEEKFSEVKYDIPNCFVVPPELREKLKSKTNEMNQKECRAKVVFGADNTVYLLGHTKEVEELSDAVIEFILDQSSIEARVELPFPELVQLLPELLQLHNFDFSGVTFSPLTAYSRPTVVLEGSANNVAEVKNRLGLFLDSIVQDKVTIEMAGAVRFFDCHAGRESLLKVAHAHKCLIQLEEQPHISRHNLGFAKYNLQHGLQVLVCEGDITKQDADALVNAANGDLNHIGGVAAALSKAGGPQVQKESKTIVKQTGKIPTGKVVVTTGGNLKCKALLHAVGPVGGKESGRERIMLEKTVHNVLNLAEMMEFKSIAMPCISSGVFGVPIRVCSDAIVTAIKTFDSQGGRSLSKIVLIDNRVEVVRAMQEACDRLLQEKGTRRSTQGDVGFQINEGAAGGATAGSAADTVLVEIVQGTIETQQVDAIVSPMASLNPVSTNIGQALASVVGPQLTAKFHKEAGGATLPGDTVVVESLPGLKCKTVIFLNLDRWDNTQDGAPVQELRQGMKKVLASCEIRGFSSVAFPVLGTGALLHFPHKLASNVLLEEVRAFEQNRISKTPFLVRIVVHPKDKESSKAFQSTQGALHLRGFTNDVNPNKASFYRHVSVKNDEVTALLGGVTLEIVCGDITKAGTDVIVNTTGFLKQHSGVSKAILTAAGPSVHAELAKVGIPADMMCTTGPGLLGCKEIIHADFQGDPQLTLKNCKKILAQCESKGFRSVAFPAINTGQAGMSYDTACKAMLDGIASAITDLRPNSLSLIRIVILQQPVFQAFRSELENRFGQIVRLSLKENARQKLKMLQEKCSVTFSTSSASQSQSFISSKPQPAVLRVISCGQDINKSIKTDLEEFLQKALLERTVDVHEFSKLNAMEMDAVLARISLAGISLDHKKHQSSQRVNVGLGERDQSGSGKDVYVLKGLAEDVLSVTELINKAVHKALEDDLKDKEEAMMALTVQWGIKDDSGEWQELNLRDNYMLENAHLTKQVSVEMETPDTRMVRVNLKTLEATDWVTGKTYKLKRTESQTDLELPQHWESMHGQYFKKVELQHYSSEYQKVATDFLKTAKYSIHKIERVQNVFLWQAFSVCRQRIIAKNGSAELHEKFLYHGTSAESCNCIERDRFDRSYAGTHAAVYGKGVYFAVNAKYSADTYSPADVSGLKRLYVARVLVGRYTVGNSSMKAPPPRGSDPTDCFNSLVDNQQHPSMFIIFHDDQAYPEYLITFR
ncbi:protein mono-ADP-ribosyltransferase PARP14 [Kryptolebias marmoratus]|uniref:Poly [ADP-ribose] polymerase n=1 Tax=Kryptolebias marmoratus TaxID=37003 RepID=A0A3Q3GGB6_KRYMA|nr:protein mono-ADP-ribosyltransferase PARP14 [Kryptolebias marmoratus]